MEKQELTVKQQELLDAIKRFIEENGYTPSLVDLAGAIGRASTFSIRKMLDQLENKGWIKRTSHTARTIQILP